jgi:hypothetical protein
MDGVTFTPELLPLLGTPRQTDRTEKSKKCDPTSLESQKNELKTVSASLASDRHITWLDLGRLDWNHRAKEQ